MGVFIITTIGRFVGIAFLLLLMVGAVSADSFTLPRPFPYNVSENATHYNATMEDDYLTLAKSRASYSFEFGRISMQLNLTPTQINARSVQDGVNWYIPIPKSIRQKAFLWDNKLPVVYNETGESLDQSNYWYSNHRLYYNQTARTFGVNAKYLIFQFNSWTVGSGGNAWSGNSSFESTTINQGTGNVELQDAVSDYISRWRFDGNALDENRTSANDGTITNATYTNGYFGQSALFNSTAFITVPDSAELKGMSNLSIFMFSNLTSNTVSSGIVSKWGTSNQYISGYRDSSGYQRCYFNGASIIYTSGSPPLNAWTMELCEYKNGKSINLTYNLTEVFSGSINLGAIPTAAQDITLGRFLTASKVGRIDEIRIYDKILSNQEKSDVYYGNHTTSGNLTTWHDAGANNETYQVDVNVTTPTNTNYTISIYNNDTDAFIQDWTNQTGNNSFTITGTKSQDTKANITLNGTTTTTPELMAITFFTQAVSAASTFIPPNPINLTNTTGNFWVNHTWAAGVGNITDSFNVSHNGTWTNGSANTFKNESVGAGNWSNITVFGWNSSGTGTLSTSSISQNTQAPSVTVTTLRNPFVAVGAAAMGVAISIAIYNYYRRRRPGMMMIFNTLEVK